MRPAPSAVSKRYSRMAVPKVFINRHLDSHLGGIIRPCFNYTLVYVKRGIFCHAFTSKKFKESMGERGSTAKGRSRQFLIRIMSFARCKQSLDKTFGTVECGNSAWNPRWAHRRAEGQNMRDETKKLANTQQDSENNLAPGGPSC